MPRKSRFSLKDIQDMETLFYKNGWTWKRIAEKYNVNRNYAARAVKKYRNKSGKIGVNEEGKVIEKFVVKRSKFSTKDYKDILKLREEGVTYKEIAKRYNSSVAGINYLIRNKPVLKDEIIYSERIINRKKTDNSKQYSNYSLKDAEEMEKLYVDGKTFTEIGKVYGASHTTVERLIKGINKTSDGVTYKSKYDLELIKTRNRINRFKSKFNGECQGTINNSKFSREDMENMVNLYESGISLQKIGKMYGISYNTVGKLIRSTMLEKEQNK